MTVPIVAYANTEEVFIGQHYFNKKNSNFALLEWSIICWFLVSGTLLQKHMFNFNGFIVHKRATDRLS